MDDCNFCRIAAAAEPSHVIFEDEHHLGFLDIFPNTEGFSVVITKAHHPSGIAIADAEVVFELMKAARLVAAKIVRAYDDVDRCAVVIEGMMIDHLHAKVIPMHQTAGLRPGPDAETTARGDQYFEAYPGYITTKIVNRHYDDAETAPHPMPVHLGHLNYEPSQIDTAIDKWHHDTLPLDYVLAVADPAEVAGGRFEWFRGTKHEAAESAAGSPVTASVPLLSPVLLPMPGHAAATMSAEPLGPRLRLSAQPLIRPVSGRQRAGRGHRRWRCMVRTQALRRRGSLTARSRWCCYWGLNLSCSTSVSSRKGWRVEIHGVLPGLKRM